MSGPRLRPAGGARRAAALPLLGLLALAGCGGSSPKATTENGCTVVSRPSLGARTEPKPTKLLAANVHYTVTLLTNCGSFSFRIDQAQSPHASAAFVALVEAGYFNRTIFHRIAPGFVIQGGDPTGTGEGGPGFTTVDPPPASAVYTHGVVAMAKTGAQAPGSAGSQFFVVTEPDAGLPPDYAIIGKVSSGLDVVDRIGRIKSNAEQQPEMVVEIERAEVKVSG